jgi:hypothetical protein
MQQTVKLTVSLIRAQNFVSMSLQCFLFFVFLLRDLGFCVALPFHQATGRNIPEGYKILAQFCSQMQPLHL